MLKQSASTGIKQSLSYDSLAGQFQGTPKSSRYHSDLSFKQRLKAMSTFFGKIQGQLILDAGCGPGLYSKGLILDNRVVGLDVSFEAARFASGHGLSVVNADLQFLPFKTDVFDQVLFIEVLQHFKNPEVILKSLAAIIRPGGQLWISSLHRSSLLHFLYRPFGGYHDLTFHALPEICGLLTRLGFDIQKSELLSYPFGLRWSDQGVGKLCSFMGTSWLLSAVKK